MREYDEIAEWYASERDDQTGVPEATALASSIPGAALLLDVGCGNGVPISRALLSSGHRVVGLDSSSAMLVRYKQNCPEAFAVKGIVESCPFADGLFDAAVAWGVMFHLNPEDAIRAIANVSRILKRGAPFLFTSGDEDRLDAKEGTMNGVTFRYFSYSPHSYRRILRGRTALHCLISTLTAERIRITSQKKAEPPSGCRKIALVLKTPGWHIGGAIP